MIVRGDIWNLARQPGILTPRQLQVLELRELHGCSWNQIAYMLDKDQGTIRGHYQRGRRRLVNALEHQEASP